MSFNSQVTRGLCGAIAAVLFAAATSAANAAGWVPSGEVEFAHNAVEPVYNDIDGSFGFLLTPENAQVNLNSRNVADIYVVTYPADVANEIGTVNCQHQPMDNCPDHGPPIAGLAESLVPAVYHNGVWGHDHLASMPAAPAKRGGEFNPTWLPVVVLFKSLDAVTHITTLSQLNAARARGDILEVPLPGAMFHGSPVSDDTYVRGTPVVPAPPVP